LLRLPHDGHRDAAGRERRRRLGDHHRVRAACPEPVVRQGVARAMRKATPRRDMSGSWCSQSGVTLRRSAGFVATRAVWTGMR
jgi:hypothetical protein